MSMMSPILKQAPCSAEKLQSRLSQSEQYLTAKTSMVHFWTCDSREQYRRLENEGKAVFDPPIHDQDAFNVFVPSSHGGDSIPLRIICPKEHQARGIFLFIHGGEFFTGSVLSSWVLKLLLQEASSSDRQHYTTTSSAILPSEHT